MSSKHRLTVREIESAKPIPGKVVCLWDSYAHGLHLRIMQSGHRSWCVQRRPKGQTRDVRVTLGNARDISLFKARELAGPVIEQLASGINPNAEARQLRQDAERREKGQFATALDGYLDRVADKLRSGAEIRRVFKKYVMPTWRTRLLHEIKRRDVIALLDSIEEKHGASMASKSLDCIRAFFNWFAARDDDFVSPVVKGMARTRPRDIARSRTLTDQEIQDLWAATEATKPPIFGELVRLLLLTGQRRNDWACARWDEIADETLMIAPQRYKTGVEHRVPITSAVSTILEKLPRFVDVNDKPLPYIVTTTGDAPFSGFSKAKERLDAKMLKTMRERAQENGKLADKIELAEWRLHDLRRTARSLMSRAGVRPDHAERAIGHVIGGVEGTYDRHRYEDEKRKALEALEQLVLRIVAGQAADVVEYGARKIAAQAA